MEATQVADEQARVAAETAALMNQLSEQGLKLADKVAAYNHSIQPLLNDPDNASMLVDALQEAKANSAFYMIGLSKQLFTNIGKMDLSQQLHMTAILTSEDTMNMIDRLFATSYLRGFLAAKQNASCCKSGQVE